MAPRASVALALLLLLAGRAVGDDGAPLEDEPTENLLIPAFPGSRAFQLRFESDFVPNASIDHKNEVSSYGPSTRLRIAGPVSERVGLQLVAKYGVHFYDFEGSTDFFATGRRSGDPFDELHEAGVRLQAAFNLNDDAHVFAPSETWSLFTEVGGGTRWEGRAVDQGFIGGGALVLGYELPKHLELAVGVQLGTSASDGDLDIGPVFKARWRITENLSVGNRGRGGQIEYQVSRKLTIFAAGFRTGKQWRLRNRRGLPNRLSFEDKQTRAALGFQWKLDRQLRLRFETGVVAKRKLEVSTDGNTLSEVDGDPSGFLVVTIDLRP